MSRPILLCGCFALILAGCQKSEAVTDQKTASDVVTGQDQQVASANPTCKLFSKPEVESYIGEAVGEAENSAGSGCAWSAKDGDGEVIIAIIPAADHEKPRDGTSRNLASPGKDGFVTPQLGGWVAGAIVGEHAIRVTVMGQGASDANAAKLLSDTSSRL